MNMGLRIDGWWKPKDNGDFTRPVHFSTHNRHLIKFNLEKFQSPNSLDSFGRTPLIIACLIKARRREIKALLDAGANVNFLWESQNPYRKLSPLAIAIHFQDLELAKYFLNHGADPNLRVFNGFTALHLAVVYQQLELVGWLIDAKADTNAKDNFGYTPLHLAALFSKRICKILLDEEDTKINCCGCDGETPLHIAAYGNRLENVKMFVERQANIDYEMRGHWTPIECSPSDSVVRKFLINRNAKCKKCFEHDKADWIPFNCYLPSPLIKLLKAITPLLASPENEVFNKFKCDPDKFKIPETRTKVGRPMDSRCPVAYIDPPWYWIPFVTDFPNLGIRHIMTYVPKKPPSSKTSSYEYVKRKLDNGSTMEKKDYFLCFMQLINMWGSFITTKKTLSLAGYCLSLLLDVGVDVNMKNENGYTPLFALIEEGFECAAIFLLDVGADPNLSVNGITPLMMASVRGLKEVVFALLDKGADVNALDKHGTSALHVASYYSLFNPPAIVEALIANGAQVNAAGPYGVTALHLSALSMSADRCRILLNAGAYIDSKVFDLQAVDLAFLFMNIPAAAVLKLSGDMFKSAQQYDLAQLEKHLRRGAVVNCQRSNYGTALMCVTGIPLTLFVILILKNAMLLTGVMEKISRPDVFGLVTPGIPRKYEWVHEMYEPDYTIKDQNGLTAFHHAVDHKNYITLVMFLKKWGIDMLFTEDSIHHIDNLIRICENSRKSDWMMEDDALYVLKGWKGVYEKEGKENLENLINAHFYDYVGFATLILKFGWRKALQYFRQSGTTLH